MYSNTDTVDTKYIFIRLLCKNRSCERKSLHENFRRASRKRHSSVLVFSFLNDCAIICAPSFLSYVFQMRRNGYFMTRRRPHLFFRIFRHLYARSSVSLNPFHLSVVSPFCISLLGRNAVKHARETQTKPDDRQKNGDDKITAQYLRTYFIPLKCINTTNEIK